MSYDEAWTMAVESELMLHCRALSEVDCYKDFHIQDWALLLLSYSKIVTQSRYVQYTGDVALELLLIIPLLILIFLLILLFEVGLFKVIMAVGIVFSANTNNLVTTLLYSYTTNYCN